MSNTCVNLVLGARSFGSSSRRQVMHVLADHADSTGRCFPSIGLLEAETELSKSTVVRCMSDLERAGWILVARKSHGRNLRGNQYLLDTNKLRASQRRVDGVTMTPVDEIDGVTMTLSQVSNRGSQVSPRHFDGVTMTPVYIEPPITPNGTPRGNQSEKLPPSHAKEKEFSQDECAKIFFKSIQAVANRKTHEHAAEVIGILAQEGGGSALDGMFELETIARAGMARGEVINAFWFEDSKWKKTPASKRPLAIVKGGAMVGVWQPGREGVGRL